MRDINVANEPEDFGMAKMLLSLDDYFYELSLSLLPTLANSQMIAKSELNLFSEELFCKYFQSYIFPLKENGP